VRFATVTSRRAGRRGISLGADSRGGAAGWVAVALVALLGLVGIAFDVGSLEVSAQRCQEVADGAALAAATELPDGAVTSTALDIVNVNNTEGKGWQVNSTAEDVIVYGPGSTVRGISLGPNTTAVEVTVHGPVTFGFSRVLGLENAAAQRTAVATRGIAAGGFPLVTMWIDTATAFNCYERNSYLDQILMAEGPHYPGIAGSFGFLQAPEGSTAGWFDLLQGYDLDEEDIATSLVAVGDTVYAKTGVDVGLFKAAFASDQGRSRIERGSTGIYQYDTSDSFTDGNPRVIMCPLVTYDQDSGANAAFTVDGFAAFYLEGIEQGQKQIHATFLDFYIPDDPIFGSPDYDGFYTVRLLL